MAQKVELWQSDNGRIFQTKEEAEKHENFMDFSEWYEKNPLMVDGMGVRTIPWK